MDSIDRDRSKRQREVGEPRPRVSAETWWRLGVGATLLLVAGGGVSPRTVARALAVAGGGMLVYDALTGSDGLLARLEEISSDDRRTAVETSTMASYAQRPTGTADASVAVGASSPKEPVLAGSENIPPIDMRGA